MGARNRFVFQLLARLGSPSKSRVPHLACRTLFNVDNTRGGSMPRKKTYPGKLAGYLPRFKPHDENEKIEKAISSSFQQEGIHLTDEVFEQLKQDIGLFFYNRATEVQIPTLQEIKNQPERINKAAAEFYDLLKNMDRFTKHEILRHGYWTTGQIMPLSNRVGMKEAKLWEDATFKTMLEIENRKSKRKPDYLTHNLISSIADAYETTKKTAGISWQYSEPAGPFFRVVLGLFDALDIKYHSSVALGKHIDRTLKKRKTYLKSEKPKRNDKHILLVILNVESPFLTSTSPILNFRQIAS